MAEDLLDEPADDSASTAREGDDFSAQRKEFDDFVKNDRRKLFSFASLLTGNPHDAADLVQATYLRALENIGQYSPGTSMIKWLFTLMKNIFNTNCKRRGTDRRALEALEISETMRERYPDEDLVAHITLRRVMTAIDMLPERWRPLLLGFAQGESYQEIADTLDIPRGTVMSRISRARDRLIILFAEQDAEQKDEPRD